jgi:glutaredoxin 3
MESKRLRIKVSVLHGVKMNLKNKTVVFSKTECPHCVVAKEALNEKGLSFDTIQVNVDISKEDMQSVIQQATGLLVETVPQVFIQGDYIGGADDLIAHFNKEQSDIASEDFSDFNI